MAESAWQCGDPGVQYDTTINDWHTSSNSGRINASNPCFPGETRIHTTAGLLPIADLYRRMADRRRHPRLHPPRQPPRSRGPEWWRLARSP